MTFASPASPMLSSRASRARAEQRDLRLRRALAFTGVAPLGAFFVVHTITTATALSGSARFGRIFAHDSAALTGLTVAFVLAPLLFHAVFGSIVALSRTRRIGPISPPTFLPRVRRAAALVTFVFLAWHVLDVPMRVWLGRVAPESLHDLLSAQLSATALGFPFRAVLMLFGIAATAFHFATAMWSFCSTWSVTPTFRAQRISAWGFGLAGVLLFLVGARTVVYFATGLRLFSAQDPRTTPSLEGVLPHSQCPAAPEPEPELK